MGNYKSKKDTAKESILLKILSNGYKPFDRLPPERVLANMLNVSRITVRAALEELVHDHILKREGRNGTIINRIPSGSVRTKDAGDRRTICHVFYPSHKFDWSAPDSCFYFLHKGIERFVEQHNGVLMMQSGDNFEKMLNYDHVRPDGIIVGGTCIEEKIPHLLQYKMPVVVVDYLPVGLAVDAVGGDNYEAGFLCGRELIKRNRSRVMFVGIQIEGEQFIQPNFGIRLEGLKKGLGDSVSVVEYHVPWRSSFNDGLFTEFGQRIKEKIKDNAADGIVFGSSCLYPLLSGLLRHPASINPGLELAIIDEIGVQSVNDEIIRVCLDMEKVGYFGCKRLYEKIDNPSAECIKYLISACFSNNKG